MATTWERKAKAVIKKTLDYYQNEIDMGLFTESELRRILSKKYPFGERLHHPYKVWLRCVDEAIADVFGDSEQLDLFERRA